MMSLDGETPLDPDTTPTLDPSADQPSSSADRRGAGASEDRPTGKKIGPYEIRAEIGRIVYKAFHPALKRTVALKVLIAGEDASEEAITRFHHEAEAVAKLGHHPNIAPVYDIGREGRNHYFAMHFVEGTSLDRMIDGGEMTPKRAAVIAKKLAEALAHAHSHGILHRDVKPANVLMGKQEGLRASEIPNPKSQIPTKSDVLSEQSESRGQIPNLNDTVSGRSGRAEGASGESGSEPMLTDFGLAKDVASESKMTRSGVTLGTPQYMPPEQADGRLDEIDERSDVYALGATLYEMLTLQPPFEGSTVIELIQKALLKDPVPPRKRNPSVDKDLETICLKCLERDPDRRYASARGLAQDLGNYLDRKPIRARPISVTEKLLRRMKRNKGVSIAIAVVVLLLLAGGVGAWVSAGWLAKGEAEREREKSLREKAESRTEQTLALGERGTRVSRVLLGASMKLGRIHDELRGAYFDAAIPVGEKQKVFETHRGTIEDFVRGGAADDDSTATKLAIKAWLLWHGVYKEEAHQLFGEAQRLSPDVPWGYLFEMMTWLMLYLANLPHPEIRISDEGLEVVSIGEESALTRDARLRFEALLEKVKASRIWGENLGKDFTGLSEGLEGIARGDLAAGEKGLVDALKVAELAWVIEELHLALARICYQRKRFEEGLRHAE
ncbi:MAG: serine/threonine-protein kinase, partial [Planctomycetota bacterium]